MLPAGAIWSDPSRKIANPMPLDSGRVTQNVTAELSLDQSPLGVEVGFAVAASSLTPSL
jgi:hypothetical protein